MTKHSNRIHFRCSTCMSPMAVRRSAAGTRCRCPFCHTVLKVPDRDQPEELCEPYHLSGPPDETANEAQVYLDVVCHVCGTRMYAEASRLGERIACPDCETLCEVRASAANRRLEEPKKPASKPKPATPDDLYDLCAAEGQPDADDAIVYGRYVPVVCSLCATRLQAKPEQIGTTITCPDCGTVNRVKEPPKRAEADKIAEATGEYGVYPLPMQPGARDMEYAYQCTRCRTRLLAKVQDAGRTTRCPDCNTELTIPPPPKVKPVERETPGEYELRMPEERPSTDMPWLGPSVAESTSSGSKSREGSAPRDDSKARESSPSRDSKPRDPKERLRALEGGKKKPSGRFEKTRPAASGRDEASSGGASALEQGGSEPRRSKKAKADRDESPMLDDEAWERAFRGMTRRGLAPLERSERAVLPDHPFLTGVWMFPFSPGVRVLWGVTSAWFICQMLMMMGAVAFSEAENPVSQFAGAMGIAMSLIMLVLFGIIGSAYFMVVLSDSADGNDCIVNWPEMAWLEWMFNFLYFLMTFIVAVGLGATVGRTLAFVGVPPLLAWTAGGLTAVVAAPIALLSALEVGLPFVPLSWPILRSVFHVPRAWLAFWTLSALLLAATAAAAGLLMIWLPQGSVVPVGILIPWAGMVYFRMLGRLAWCCMEKARELDREEDAAEKKRNAEADASLD